MDWIKVSIITTNKGIDPVSSVLNDLGYDGLEIADKDDFKEFLENNRKYWDYVDEELERLKEADTKITVYLDGGNDGLSELEKIEKSIKLLKEADINNSFGSLKIITENVRDEDWSENWKQYFKPLEIGDKILIQPEWQPLESETDRIVFKVNPGMTFGTGSHDSTRFCIEEIEKNIHEGDTVLDLGCGSGILSVAALLLGANSAVGVDIDALAVKTAVENAEINHVADKFTAIAGNLTEQINGKYHIVLANIVADVIMVLTEDIEQYLYPDSIYIMSGIIDTREQDVLDAVSEKFEIIERKEEKGWVALAARLKR